MIQQIVTPNDKIVNLSFEIPKKYVGKSLKVYIDFEKEEDNPFEKQMTQEEFVQWVKEGENSPTMSLETFNKKWEQEIQKIQKLIP